MALPAVLEAEIELEARYGALALVPDGPTPVDDLLTFTQATFPRYTPAPHHRLIADALMQVERGEIDRLIITMPPRHGKSQLASIHFPAWYLGRNPDKRIIAASYAAGLAYRISRQARNVVGGQGWPFQHRLAADLAQVQQWDIAGHRGGYIAAGAGGQITGSGADLLLIDDPIKNQEQADSASQRNTLWEWYTSTAYTRLNDERGAVIVIQCMTGDTPVRMADSTERPLCAIRVGDRVATYDWGVLASSTVVNHVSQGYDNIYRITMTSGKIVHANERHPFLVEEHGQRRWMKLKDLTTAHKIVTVRDSGASGRAAHVPSRVAGSLSNVEGTATRTTSSRNGLTGIDPLLSTHRRTANDTSSIGMVLLPHSMTHFLPRRAAFAPSASNRLLTRIPAPIGTENSASITTMKTASCADCSATIATLPSAMPSPKRPRERWSNTSDFTTDLIASIEYAGVAEVFDLQIAHTENFIANGLVSHNTRWHADDLTGRLLAAQATGTPQWTVLHLPALADVSDPLGREPGAPLWPERFDATALGRIKETVGSRVWAALYQGRPSNDDSALLKRAWWRTYIRPPERFDRVIQSWDMTFKGGATNDYVVGQVWGKVGADCYLLDQVRERLDFPATLAAIRDLAARYPEAHTKLVEDTANGPAVIATLTREIAGLVAVRPEGGKVARVNAIAGLVEAGNVWLPDSALRSWASDLIEEAAAFPMGTHDDQVDALSQALLRLQTLEGDPLLGYMAFGQARGRWTGAG